MRWSACQWAGHLFVFARSVWGQDACLRCGIHRDRIGPHVQYVTVRPS